MGKVNFETPDKGFGCGLPSGDWSGVEFTDKPKRVTCDRCKGSRHLRRAVAQQRALETRQRAGAERGDNG